MEEYTIPISINPEFSSALNAAEEIFKQSKEYNRQLIITMPIFETWNYIFIPLYVISTHSSDPDEIDWATNFLETIKNAMDNLPNPPIPPTHPISFGISAKDLEKLNIELLAPHPLMEDDEFKNLTGKRRAKVEDLDKMVEEQRIKRMRFLVSVKRAFENSGEDFKSQNGS